MEKAEALANSLGDNTNWRSTADKFRSLFQQWQDHQHNSVRLDKADADALWSRFSSARTTFNSARRKWAQGRDEERSNAKAAKEAIIAEAGDQGFHRLGGNLPQVQRADGSLEEGRSCGPS